MTIEIKPSEVDIVQYSLLSTRRKLQRAIATIGATGNLPADLAAINRVLEQLQNKPDVIVLVSQETIETYDFTNPNAP